MTVMSEQDRLKMRDYYDELADDEWLRLERNPAARVSLEVHRRFLRRFITPDMTVLEIGAGPGRFTLELAGLGAKVLVTDFSPVQLELNATRIGATDAEAAVVGRKLVDVCDTSQFADGQFDAVVAYGGPLSYAFEQTEDAMRGLLRITCPGGPVVASVMSTLGTWRHVLPAVTELADQIGEEANDAIIATGDLRIERGAAHVCQMFRSDEIVDLVTASGGTLLDASASNWASMNPPELLEPLESDPDRWAHFLDNEVNACAAPGAWNGGTHLLFAYTHA